VESVFRYLLLIRSPDTPGTSTHQVLDKHKVIQLKITSVLSKVIIQPKSLSNLEQIKADKMFYVCMDMRI